MNLFDYVAWLGESGRITVEEHSKLLDLIQEYRDEITDELYSVL